MDDHSCTIGNSSVRIGDVNGATMAQYLRLCDGSYYGGRSQPQLPGTNPAVNHHPHTWVGLTGMLDLIARLANDPNGQPPLRYEISGKGLSYPIGKQMMADHLAAVLGCEVKEVTDYFRLSVEMEAPSG